MFLFYKGVFLILKKRGDLTDQSLCDRLDWTPFSVINYQAWIKRGSRRSSS